MTRQAANEPACLCRILCQRMRLGVFADGAAEPVASEEVRACS